MEYSEGIYNISDLKFKYPDMWFCESIFDKNNYLTVDIKINKEGGDCYTYRINFGKAVFFQQIEESWFDMVDTTFGRWKNFDSNYLLFEVKDSELVEELDNTGFYNTPLHHYFMTTTNWYLEIVTSEMINIKQLLIPN